LFLTNKWHKLILLFIAVLVAFSRVYLSQHFLEDITMGSFIGISLSTGVYYLFYSTSMSLKLVSLQQPLAKIIRNRNE